MKEESLIMKRFILRLTVAMLTFAFGVAIDRALTSMTAPVQKPRTEWKLEPVVTKLMPACPQSNSIPLTAPTPAGHVVLNYNPADFNPRGMYFPLSRLPKEFAEVDIFQLSNDESDGTGFGSGIVQTRRNNTYDFQDMTFLLITERGLFFLAAPRFDTDFEYRFDGEFLGNPGRLVDTGKAAVRGKLSKWKDGRKIAERELSFDVKYLGC
jgi:hypothetical protein